MSKLDSAVFHWHRDGHLHGMIACHVNDCLRAGDDLFTQNVMKNLKCAFDIVEEDSGSFKYVGLNVSLLSDDNILQHFTTRLIMLII